MRQVYRARAVPEAHLVKGYLESAGITVVVSGEDIAGLQGLLPVGSETSPAVWVADQDYTQAEALVATFLQEPSALAGATHWRCPTCGEDLEPQFTECWQCGTSRLPDESPPS
jgi:hypothetical protein